MSISISEIIVILLIGIVVIKPEQLPDVAFTLGRTFRAVKKLFAKVKTEVNEFVNISDQIEKKRD